MLTSVAVRVAILVVQATVPLVVKHVEAGNRECVDSGNCSAINTNYFVQEVGHG